MLKCTFELHTKYIVKFIENNRKRINGKKKWELKLIDTQLKNRYSI